MKKNYGSGMALAMAVAVGALALSGSAAQAAESKAKQQLMSAIDQCEMKDRTDARESCMDDAWAAYKKAHAMEGKTK